MTSIPHTYRYAFGGYVLDTNIYFPELIVSTDIADCSIIVKNKIPVDINKTTLTVAVYYNSALELLQINQQAGWIFLKNNKELDFVPHQAIEPALLRIYLLGSVFAVMSVALQFFPFHASAILINGKAVLFCGRSGVGKSTMAAYFYSKKYPILSDDVTNVKLLPNGQHMAYPALQRIKLSSLSLNLIGADHTSLDKIPLKEHKFSYPVKTNDVIGGHPLGAVIFLKFNDGETIFEENVSLKSKIKLSEFLFRKKLTKKVYNEEYKATSLFKIALAVNSYNFSRPAKESEMIKNCEFIEHKLLELLNK